MSDCKHSWIEIDHDTECCEHCNEVMDKPCVECIEIQKRIDELEEQLECMKKHTVDICRFCVGEDRRGTEICFKCDIGPSRWEFNENIFKELKE